MTSPSHLIAATPRTVRLGPRLGKLRANAVDPSG
jgi:hypothetical protein